MLFCELKRVARTPRGLVTFHDEHAELRKAVRNLESFLMRLDFQRRVFAERKLFARARPITSNKIWKEYDGEWAYAIAHLRVLRDFDLPYDPDQSLREVYLDQGERLRAARDNPFQRENFLYFSRCGTIESVPSRRILSFS
jgi:hypothetical protein